MDFNLTEDQSAFRDMARSFAREEFAPQAENGMRRKFSRLMLKTGRRLGFAGIYVGGGTWWFCFKPSRRSHYF